jgi:hypothetical protein
MDKNKRNKELKLRLRQRIKGNKEETNKEYKNKVRTRLRHGTWSGSAGDMGSWLGNIS